MGAILQLFVHHDWRHASAALLTLGAMTSPLAGSLAAPACLGETAEARAVAVPDARSVTLADGRVVRVAGVESFALLEAEGDAAEAALRDRLEALVAQHSLRVRLVSNEPDRYGRLPALLADDNGDLVQEALAREGLAIAFAGGDELPCFAEILAAEDDARRARRGFWAHQAVLPARPQALQTRIGHFAIFEGDVISVGNRRSLTYLNFGTWWSEDVTVEIEARDRTRFGGEAGLAELAGKQVRIRGFLEEKAGPMVKVSSPMQLEILGPIAPADGETP